MLILQLDGVASRQIKSGVPMSGPRKVVGICFRMGGPLSFIKI